MTYRDCYEECETCLNRNFDPERCETCQEAGNYEPDPETEIDEFDTSIPAHMIWLKKVAA